MQTRPLFALTLSLVVTSALLGSACSDSDDMNDTGDNLPVDPTGPGDGDGDGDGSMPSPTLDAVPQTRIIPTIGTVYTNNQDLTLYTRYVDTPGTNNCDSTCEQTWPPLITDVSTMGISGQFDVIERTDGRYQWTLDDYPLYLYTGDAAADEANGEGLAEDEWAVARPLPITSADVLGEEGLVSSTSTLASPAGNGRVELTGHTLYVFDTDPLGSSTCNGPCATNWPPLLADKGGVDRDRYTVISRDNGTNQWAYDGKPLYFYEGDSAPGMATGDGLGGLWSVARP